MDLTNDIKARLQKGERIEDIAAELTKSINAANEQYAAEKAAAEKAAAAKVAQEALFNEKVDAVDDLLAALSAVLVVYDLDADLVEAVQEINPEEIVEALDQSLPFLAKYIDLHNELESMVGSLSKTPTATKSAETKPETNDPLEAFLNDFVRNN